METSFNLIETLISLAELNINDNVLEPSAGSGSIVSEIIKYVPGNQIYSCEKNKLLFETLRNRFVIPENNFFHGDYLTTEFPKTINKILAVPPYKDGIDCAHIMKMYEDVAPNGIVVSATLPYWTTGSFTIHRNFRKWLNTIEYKIRFIEDHSYVNCPKAILKLFKPPF